jgi:CheY-like chemotaxis protein
MDICMPVMDGLAASREIRSFEMLASRGRSPRLDHAGIVLGAAESSSERRLTKSNSFRRVPIVALSAQVMDQDRDACMHAGMDGFLAKPMRFEDLKKLLTPIFSRYPKWQNPTP